MEAGSHAGVPDGGTARLNRTPPDPLSLSDLSPEFFSSSPRSPSAVTGEPSSVSPSRGACGEAVSAAASEAAGVSPSSVRCNGTAPPPKSPPLLSMPPDGNTAAGVGSGSQEEPRGCVPSPSLGASPPGLVSARAGVTRVMRPAVLHPLQHTGDVNTSTAAPLLSEEPAGGKKNPAVRPGTVDPFASLCIQPRPASSVATRQRGGWSSSRAIRSREGTGSVEHPSSYESSSLEASPADPSVQGGGNSRSPLASSLTALPATSRLVFPTAFSAIPPSLPASLQHRWRVCVYRHLFLIYPHPSIWASCQSPPSPSSSAACSLPDVRSSFSSRCLPPPQPTSPFSRDLSLPCLFIDRRSGALRQRLLSLRTGFLLQQVAPRLAAAAMSAGELTERDMEPPPSFGHFHLALDSDALLGTLTVGGRRYLVLVTESESVADFEEEEAPHSAVYARKTELSNKRDDSREDTSSVVGIGDGKWSRRVVKVVKRAVCLPYHVKNSSASIKRETETLTIAERDATAGPGRKGVPASAAAVVRGFAATEPRRQLSARKFGASCLPQDKRSAAPCFSSPCLSLSSSSSSPSAHNEGLSSLELQCAASRPAVPVLDLSGHRPEIRDHEDKITDSPTGLTFSDLDRTPRREDPDELRAGALFETSGTSACHDGCRQDGASLAVSTAALTIPAQPSQGESIATSLFSGRMAIGGLVSAAADSLGGALSEGGKSNSMTQWVSQQLGLAQGAANPLFNRWLGEGVTAGGGEEMEGPRPTQGKETEASSAGLFFPGLAGQTSEQGNDVANGAEEGNGEVRRPETEGFIAGLTSGAGGSRWPFGLSELAAAAGQVTADLMNGSVGGQAGQSRQKEARSASHPSASNFLLGDGHSGLPAPVPSSASVGFAVRQHSDRNGASIHLSSNSDAFSSVSVASATVVSSNVVVRDPEDPSSAPTVAVTSLTTRVTEDMSAVAEADRYASAVEKLLCSCCYYSYDLELTRSLQNLEDLGVSTRRQKLPGYAERPGGEAVAFWWKYGEGEGGKSGVVNEADRESNCLGEAESGRRGNQAAGQSSGGRASDGTGEGGGGGDSLGYSWNGAGLISVADRRFTWNVQLYREWEAAGLDQRWMVPLIQGYVAYVRMESTSSVSSPPLCQRFLPARSCGMVAPRQQVLPSSRSASLRGEETEEAEGPLLVRSVELLLICRRSSKRGGTRYNARGIDDEGNVANFAESEQRVRLMAYTAPCCAVSTPGLQSPTADPLLASGERCAETLGRWASLVQVRGSVPVFWEQTGLTAQTAVTRNTILTTTAFEKHQEDLFSRYGPVVCYVDLLSGSRTNEARLVAALEQQIAAYEHDHPRAPGVRHVHYDFHQQVKSKAYEAALGEFVETRLLDAAAAIGFYLEPSRRYRKKRQACVMKQRQGRGDARGATSKGEFFCHDDIRQGTPRSASRRTEDETEGSGEGTEKAENEAADRGHKQRGVLRTNCLDCLDRTNVFQWYFCWFWLNQHLRANHFDSFLLPVKRRNLITCSAASPCHGVTNLSAPFFRSPSSSGRCGNLILFVGGGGFASSSGASGGLGVHHRTKIRSRSSSLRDPRSTSGAAMAGSERRGAEWSERTGSKGAGGGFSSVSSSGGKKAWHKNSGGSHVRGTCVPSPAGEGRDRWPGRGCSEEAGAGGTGARGRGAISGGDDAEEEVSVLREEVKRIWADQGDSISLLYTGTGSVFTSHMRQGGKATFSSNLDHALKALGRFYQNTFEDTYRQEVIDVFLGLHRLSVSTSSPAEGGSSDTSCRKTALLVGKRTTTTAMKLASQRQLELSTPPQSSSTSPGASDGTRQQSARGFRPQSRNGFFCSPLVHASATFEVSSTDRDSSVGEAKADNCTAGVTGSRQDSAGSGDFRAAATAAPALVNDSKEHAAGSTVAQRAVGAARRSTPEEQAQQLRGEREAGVKEEGAGGSMLPLRVWVGTWNLAGRDLHEWEDIEEWLTPVKQQADLYVFCIQELVELTGFRVLMNLKDTDKEARLEQKAAAALNNLAHHFPQPPFAACRQQRLSRAFSHEPRRGAREESLRSLSSIVSSSSFVSCTGLGRDEGSTSEKGRGEDDSGRFDDEGGIFGYFKRDAQLSSGLPLSLFTGGGVDTGWADEGVGRRQASRGVSASPGVVEGPRSGAYSQAPTFVKVRSCSMVGLMILVFIRTELKKLLAGVEISTVKVGLKGNAGNKGAVGVSLRMGLTSFCFLNVHLASGQGSSHERMQQMSQVLQQAFQSGPAYTANALEHDYTVVAGDFNFRLVANHQQVVGALNHPKSALLSLLKLDQFYISQRHSLPPFFHFHEAPVEFQPTYKYKRNSSHYDLKRTPAWCDRILYCGRRVHRQASFCPLPSRSEDQVTREDSSASAASPGVAAASMEAGSKDGFHSSPTTATSFFRDPSSSHRDSARKPKPEEDGLPPPCRPLTVLSYTDHPRYFSSDHKPVSLVFTCSVCIPGLLDLSAAAPGADFSKPASCFSGPSGIGCTGSRTLKRPPFLPSASSSGDGGGNGFVPAEVVAPSKEPAGEGEGVLLQRDAESFPARGLVGGRGTRTSLLDGSSMMLDEVQESGEAERLVDGLARARPSARAGNGGLYAASEETAEEGQWREEFAEGMRGGCIEEVKEGAGRRAQERTRERTADREESSEDGEGDIPTDLSDNEDDEASFTQERSVAPRKKGREGREMVAGALCGRESQLHSTTIETRQGSLLPSMDLLDMDFCEAPAKEEGERGCWRKLREGGSMSEETQRAKGKGYLVCEQTVVEEEEKAPRERRSMSLVDSGFSPEPESRVTLCQEGTCAPWHPRESLQHSGQRGERAGRLTSFLSTDILKEVSLVEWRDDGSPGQCRCAGSVDLIRSFESARLEHGEPGLPVVLGEDCSRRGDQVLPQTAGSSRLPAPERSSHPEDDGSIHFQSGTSVGLAAGESESPSRISGKQEGEGESGPQSKQWSLLDLDDVGTKPNCPAASLERTRQSNRTPTYFDDLLS
ncbi:endonuclease exonuclease phosphatase domain-containing protein [Cystoisospora suis]|uniref:phosphoinositide 5-phosphatase n=1 Tax=Cystoisospora suis TaxID=483139 RepID=A0A2C6KGV4_9APIC|nr:endonuclease exonuclease phosphatase domain-containing protein [Cystoisospora suis]